MKEQSLPMVVAVMGPTASGKSALALRLAKDLGMEIISADSAQVYRQTSIGTAKPTPEEQREVPHHLINIRDLDEGFCLADYISLASSAIEDVWARGRIPLVVGGSGLYVRGLLEGYALDAPSPDMELRARLNAWDMQSLLDELGRRDPETFQSIDRSNRRRVSRALEVVMQTGRSWLECSRRQPPPWRVLKFGLMCERDTLRLRIQKRLQNMLSDGWADEVAGLLREGWEDALMAANILGYREVAEFVKGQMTREQMEEEIFIKTCRFAKRQRTWLRAEPRLIALASGEDAYGNICRLISEQLADT